MARPYAFRCSVVPPQLKMKDSDVAVFRNRERFIKIVVWFVVLSMLIALLGSLASIFGS